MFKYPCPCDRLLSNLEFSDFVKYVLSPNLNANINLLPNYIIEILC